MVDKTTISYRSDECFRASIAERTPDEIETIATKWADCLLRGRPGSHAHIFFAISAAINEAAGRSVGDSIKGYICKMNDGLVV